MKVGIVTKIGKNYGAVLQAYALKKALENLNVESHVIKYIPDISNKTYKVCKFPWGRRGTIANFKALIHYRDIAASTRKFLEFREHYFDFLGEYRSNDDLIKNPPSCDVYISGSDQVWNPQISFDETFYLNFSEENTKKTAYAASIGLKSLPDNVKEDFKRRVSNFDFISVRELQAKNILNDLGIKSIQAPDPTLLFDANEWNNIAVDTIKGPYILCYFVSFPKGIKHIVDSFQKKMGLKVVNLMTSEESSNIGDIKIRNAGPCEFLGLFKNADFVITSSFHGTVFSLINRKSFVTVLYNSTSSRVTELLDQLQLSNRIISCSERDVTPYLHNIYTKQVERNIHEIRDLGNKILGQLVTL